MRGTLDGVACEKPVAELIFWHYRALPASALDEPESDDEDEVTGVERDDERSGTKYNVSDPLRLSVMSMTNR